MGIGGSSTNKTNKRESFIKCIYEIKDFQETQIINYRDEDYINEDIEEEK